MIYRLRLVLRVIAVATVLTASLTAYAVPIGGHCAQDKYENFGGEVYACGLTGETFWSCTYGCSCITCN